MLIFIISRARAAAGCSDTAPATCLFPQFCIQGYFLNTAANTCTACSTSCLTCAGSASTCTLCNSVHFRTLSSGQCNCIPGYFDNGADICMACGLGCKTCTAAATCTSCYTYYTDGATCSCPSKTFPKLPTGSLLKGGCVPCPKSCITCTSAAVCTACSDNLYISGGYCVSASTKSMKLGCLQYSTVTSLCTSCAYALFRAFSSTTNDCPCVPGYFDVGMSACSACHYTCMTCSGLANNNCIRCSNTNFRTGPSTGRCPCITGYYDGGLPMCLLCPLSCKSCTSPNSCQTCINGYYSVASSCGACMIECLSCTSSDACTYCPNFSFRQEKTVAGKSRCSCVIGYYENNTTICPQCHQTCVSGCTDGNPCQLCHYSCLICSGTTSTSCTGCEFSKFRYLSAGQCLCAVGYYDQGLASTTTSDYSACAACDSSCMTCRNFAQFCLSCDVSAKRQLVSNSCPCIAKHFDNSGTCSPCHSSCLSCTSTSNTGCISCLVQANRYLDAVNNRCPCNDGFYDSGNEGCYSCLPECIKCTGAAICTTCISGYFLNTNTCTACSRPCVTCSTALNCLSCDTTRYNYVVGSPNTCQCITGYYNNNNYCDSCLPVCLGCTDAVSCSSCSGNMQLSAGNCIFCHQNCLTCNGLSSSSCLTCPSNLNRQRNPAAAANTPTTCLCRSSYFEQAGLNYCIPCDIRCLTCTSFKVCLTCRPGLQLLFDKSCSCPISQYYDYNLKSCSACIQPCLNCVTTVYCTSCVVGFFLSGFQCISGCPQGTFAKPNQNVVQCDYCIQGCKNCQQVSSCLQCSTNYYLQGSICQRACNNLFQPSNGVCQPCLSNQLYFKSCLYNCPPGLAADPVRLCVECGQCKNKFMFFYNQANQVNKGIFITLFTNVSLSGVTLTKEMVQVHLKLAGTQTFFDLPLTSLKIQTQFQVSLQASYTAGQSLKNSILQVQWIKLPTVQNNILSTALIQFSFQGLQYKKDEFYCYISASVSVLFVLTFLLSGFFISEYSRTNKLFFIQSLSLLGFFAKTLDVQSRQYYLCFSWSCLNFFQKESTGSTDSLLSSLALQPVVSSLAISSIVLFSVFGALRLAVFVQTTFFEVKIPLWGRKLVCNLWNLPVLYSVFASMQNIKNSFQNGFNGEMILGFIVILIAISESIVSFLPIAKSITALDALPVQKVVLLVIYLLDSIKFVTTPILGAFVVDYPICLGIIFVFILSTWAVQELESQTKNSSSWTVNLVYDLTVACNLFRHIGLMLLMILSFGESGPIVLVLLSVGVLVLDMSDSLLNVVLIWSKMQDGKEIDNKFSVNSLVLQSQILVPGKQYQKLSNPQAIQDEIQKSKDVEQGSSDKKDPSNQVKSVKSVLVVKVLSQQDFSESNIHNVKSKAKKKVVSKKTLLNH